MNYENCNKKKKFFVLVCPSFFVNNCNTLQAGEEEDEEEDVDDVGCNKSRICELMFRFLIPCDNCGLDSNDVELLFSSIVLSAGGDLDEGDDVVRSTNIRCLLLAATWSIAFEAIGGN